MKPNISFLAIALFKALLIGSVRAQDASLTGREALWDDDALIYTDELEKRMPSNNVEYCRPSLGITEDKIEAKKGGKASGTGYVFSSRLKFKNKNAVDVFDKADTQLAALAKDAYEEMEQVWTSVAEKKRPGVMTAMFIGKEVYLSSSLKGLGEDKSPIWNMETSLFLKGLPDGLKECMTKCQDDFRDRQRGDENLNIHRQRGACGECIAMVQYFSANKGKKTCANSVFVTVNKVGGKIQVVEPCGTRNIKEVPTEERWGCALPVKVCGGRSIDSAATKFDVYAIGKMKQKTGWEIDSHYQASDRYHTKDHIKLPKDLFEVP